MERTVLGEHYQYEFSSEGGEDVEKEVNKAGAEEEEEKEEEEEECKAKEKEEEKKGEDYGKGRVQKHHQHNCSTCLLQV